MLADFLGTILVLVLVLVSAAGDRRDDTVDGRMAAAERADGALEDTRKRRSGERVGPPEFLG